ncbi:MAG: rhodanese-like domain-containing protein [Terriglobia bacterium]
MYFKQFYLGCLAHASYLIGSDGEAVVVDPQRDVDQYIQESAAQGLKIKYVIETHLHADFVSGHRELAARTGAEIVFGEKADAAFPYRPVKEGDQLHVGTVSLRILETPGHTPESICICVVDTAVSDKPVKVLTGDTLFIGDVGRPDLVGSKGYTAPQMAGLLYDSLHEKLLKLEDAVEVYPAHGAGSMCGRNISKDTFSTLGEQRRFNYALRPMSRDVFVAMMTTDLPEAPAYFSRDAEINRTGAEPLDELPGPRGVSPAEVNTLLRQGYLILDIRNEAAFGAGHVPGALHIGLSGQFASWAGCLIAAGAPLLLVAEESAKIDEAVIRLARVGIESVKGFLEGGVYAWDKAGFRFATVPQIPVDELRHRLEEQLQLQILDVRRPAEYQNGHVPRAVNVPLSNLSERISPMETALALDTSRPLAVICQGGYRSSAATSILARHGYRNLFNVVGGTAAWIAAGFPLEKSEGH